MFSFPLTNEKFEWNIWYANNPDTLNVFIYKAVETESGKTVGYFSLGSISRKNYLGRISRVLVGDTCARGKRGIAAL